MREAEIGYIIRNLKPGEKEKKIIETFEYLYNTVNYNFYELDELEDNNDYDF